MPRFPFRPGIPIILIVGLALILLPMKAWAQSESADKTPADAVRIPIEFFHDLPVIEVSIANKGSYRFILDTGAMITVFSTELADELGFPVTGEMPVGSPLAEERQTGKLLKVDSLAVGSFIASNPSCLAMDLSGVFSEPGDPQGVLSTSIFSGHVLTFDYGRGQVRVHDGALPEANGTDVFHCGAGIPKVPLTIAGNEVNVNLDTGARSGFNLPAGFMEKLPLEDEPTEIGQARTVDAKVSILGANLSGEVKLGRFTFTNPRIGFVPGAPIGTLGTEILSDFVFAVDHANQRVRFERSSSPPAEPTTKPVRYGMLFRGIDGGEIVVAGVDPGSPAERGGIQKGDIITELNGIALTELGRNERIQSLRTSPLSLTLDRGDETLHFDLRLEQED